MKCLEKKYNLPNYIMLHIWQYIDTYKYDYERVIKQIENGCHVAVIKEHDTYLNDITYEAYDIYIPSLYPKDVLRIKLSEPYEYTLGHYLYGNMYKSQSMPLFYCTECNKYHDTKYFGKKYCDKYKIYLRSKQIKDLNYVI